MQSHLLELAPLYLENHRNSRYKGDDVALSISAFTEEDQRRIREIYEYLQGLLEALTPTVETSARTKAEAFLGAHPADHLAKLAMEFGIASARDNPTPRLLKTNHDLRGGGLTPLIGQLQLAVFDGLDDRSANALYFLTRDHLKIMRNALLGLDDARREADLLPKIHGTDLIVQKWNGAVLHARGRSIRLEVECPQPVAISECCVEFGALDRILYNLINNACRHSADDRIRLTLFPIPDKEGENLRLVLTNTVSIGDLETLRTLRLESLFEEGTSTTGSGYGLAIATEFVTHAFGLQSARTAVERGYLGATVDGSEFTIWFHWPRILED